MTCGVGPPFFSILAPRVQSVVASTSWRLESLHPNCRPPQLPPLPRDARWHNLAPATALPGEGRAMIQPGGEMAAMVTGLRMRVLIGVCFALAALAPQGNAQATSKTVTLVVPYSAGGGTDTVARLIGDQMSRALSQSVVIENVVGAGGTLANDRVARSTPDGSSVLINHVALLAAPSLFSNLRYDTQTAFEPVGLVNNAPMVLIGRKSIPGEGPKDHLGWIRAQGAKANFAHGGIGTNSHL